MAAARALCRIPTQTVLSYGALGVSMLGLAAIAQAEPTAPSPAAPFATKASPQSVAGEVSPAGSDGSFANLEELRLHAATIDDILAVASERVDSFAADGEARPALLDAIRQELSLSRRWNNHLSSILLEVAEARRALGRREREAAREIAEMTAVAEEARLELLALKDVLDRGPAKPAAALDKRTDRGTGQGPGNPAHDLVDARDRLAAVQAAEKSAIGDVDDVRSKIIDALQTLATMNEDLALQRGNAGEALTSKDITGWAASTAARLRKTGGAAIK